MSTTEVGVAYVRLLPSMEGFAAEVKREMGDGLTRPAREAGDDAGKAIAKGIEAGLDGIRPPDLGSVVGAFGDDGRRAGSAFADAFSSGVGRLSADSVSGDSGRFRAAGQDAGESFADGFESTADDVDTDGITAGIGDKLKLGLAAVGLGAGALLVEGLTSAMDKEGAIDRLGAQLGNAQFGEDMGKIAGNLYVAGFGDSIGDTADAVRKVWQNGLIPEDSADADIERVTTKLLTFSDVMEQDMDMTSQAIKSMLTSGVAKSADEALDVMTRGVQQGADKAGDLAETFQEYSTNFAALGLTGADATGLMVQGLNAGARDADKVADSLKEFGIRAKDGSDTTRDAFNALGIDAETAMLSVAAGGDSAKLALQYTLEALQAIEDPLERNNIATALFGTQSEDMQAALSNLDVTTAADGLGNVAGSTDKLGSAYDNASSKIESFKRGALMGLTDFIGGTVIPGLESFAGWVSDTFGPTFDTLATTFSTVRDSVTTFIAAFQEGESFGGGGIFDVMGAAGATLRDVWDQLVNTYNTELKPALDELIAKGKEIIEGIDWTTVWQELQPILSAAGGAFMSFATMVITAVGTAIENITRFITKVQELWNEHESFRIAVTAIWDLISTKITTAINIISGIMQLATALMRGDWSAAWDAIKSIVSNAWESIKADFRAAITPLTSTVSNGLNSIVGFFRNLPGQISSAMSTVANAITNPFRSAFNSLRSLWNSTVGGFGFTVPSWIPGVGGKGFTIPKMHGGGIFDPGGGDEGLALLKRGEGVFTPDQMAALGTGSASGSRPAVVELHADGLDRTLLEWLRRSIRVEGGGDVQLALGTG